MEDRSDRRSRSRQSFWRADGRFLVPLAAVGVIVAVAVLLPTSESRFEAHLIQDSYGSGPTTADPAQPQLALSAQEGRGGDSVGVVGASFSPGQQIALTFLSTPVALGTVPVEPTGTFTATVTIPIDATVGEHQIVASTADGATLAAARFTVLAPISPVGQTTLPRTGVSLFAFVLLASVSILLGWFLVTSSERGLAAR